MGVPDASASNLSGLLILPLLWLVAALLAVLALATRARNAVGKPIAAERPMRALRLAVVLGPQAIVLAIVLLRGDLPAGAAADVLLLGLLIAWLSPGFHDAVCGETGVQRGWHARRFEDLEEWRLTGQHLRFRLFDEWTSVPLPPAEQPRIRAKLLELNPDRESRFKD